MDWKMLAIAGALSLAAAAAVHYLNLRRGVYHRVPYESILLIGVSALLGLAAVAREGGIGALVLFALELAALSVLVAYLLSGARFPRSELSVRVGDKLPRFELTDSAGGCFDSATLEGKSAALYLFYRGNW
ncbi:MAG TPA: hypothetical protein VLK65_01100 [Vicinamibacteria bacterium]|nr:hypothetical protein [Vicinamibacteria bacterium]